MIGADRDPEAIWDEDTGETFAEAMARFETLGDEFVEPIVTRYLIEAGFEVWSFGYGDDPAEFTTVDKADLDTFDSDIEGADDLWGPFRFDANLGSPSAAVRFLIRHADEWSHGPFIDPISAQVLQTGVAELQRVGLGV